MVFGIDTTKKKTGFITTTFQSSIFFVESWRRVASKWGSFIFRSVTPSYGWGGGLV